jgi:hypothetical protein
MAGIVAEAGATEKAAPILRIGRANPSHVVALVRSRDAPMRTRRCHNPDLPLKFESWLIR